MEAAEVLPARPISQSQAESVCDDLSMPSARRGSAPVVALLLLSPVIGEVLFGATRITTLFVVLPQIGTWGCAALIIREVVRRRRLGWTAVLVLGLALAVAEECLLQQTSFAPLVGADPNHPYGRALGVNWVYFLWALGYESIWIVVIPIQLTELIFPKRRGEEWLGNRGLVIAAVVLMMSSFVAWYIWTQLFLPRFFPELAYRVPLASIAIALAACVALAFTALCLRQPVRVARNEPAGARTVDGRRRRLRAGFPLVCPNFPGLRSSSRPAELDPAGDRTGLGCRRILPDRRLVPTCPLDGYPLSRTSLRRTRRQHDGRLLGVRNRRSGFNRLDWKTGVERHRDPAVIAARGQNAVQHQGYMRPASHRRQQRAALEGGSMRRGLPGRTIVVRIRPRVADAHQVVISAGQHFDSV